MKPPPQEVFYSGRKYHVGDFRSVAFVTVSTEDLPNRSNAALSQLSGDMMLELAQLGLLDARSGRFSFRDLASARQIAKLLTGGVRLSQITRAVSQIWLPEVGLMTNVRGHTGPRF
jgi:hypothetical protein